MSRDPNDVHLKSLVTCASVGAVLGALTGLAYGFKSAGIGGAVLMALLGGAGGGLVGALIGAVAGGLIVFVTLFLADFGKPLLMFLGIGLLVWLLWGVGKP